MSPSPASTPSPARRFFPALLAFLAGAGAAPIAARPSGPPPRSRPVRRAWALDAARAVCEITRSQWGGTERWGGPHGLSARPGGRPYVRVTGGSMRRVLVFPGPERRPFGAQAEAGGLLLEGYLVPAPDGLRVFPARELTLGGLLWPGSFTPLRLLPDPVSGFRVAALGRLPAALAAPAGGLQARVACGDVSLEPSPLFPWQPRVYGPQVEPTRLRAGATLPLLARPGGPAVAVLRPSKKSGVLLWVQPGVGGWAKVEWRLPAGDLRGWVSERRLREAEVKKMEDGDGLGGLYLAAGGRGGSGPHFGDRCLRCDAEIPLTVEVPPAPGAADPRRERLVAGRFRGRACIPVVGPVAGDRDLDRGWLPPELKFEPGVRPLVTREHLSRCRPVVRRTPWGCSE